MKSPSTERFSKKVEDYIRFRPGYPPALIEFMVSPLGLSSRHVVADVGSGTGKLTELLLPVCQLVYGVEPNIPMREAAERLLSRYPGFRSVAGTAEATGLPADSVDFVTVAQAFHWFDIGAFRTECRRVLRPEGKVLLIWNDRVDEASPFMEAYEHFLQTYSTDYQQIDLRRINTAHFDSFFGAGNYRKAVFENEQHFDLDGLRGRYLSCSYALPPGHSGYTSAMEALGQLFDQFQEGGAICMPYHTTVYFG